MDKFSGSITCLRLVSHEFLNWIESWEYPQRYIDETQKGYPFQTDGYTSKREGSSTIGSSVSWLRIFPKSSTSRVNTSCDNSKGTDSRRNLPSSELLIQGSELILSIENGSSIYFCYKIRGYGARTCDVREISREVRRAY